MKLYCILSALALAAMTSPAISAGRPAAPVGLRLRLLPGHVYRLGIDIRRTTEEESQSRLVHVNQRLRIRYLFHVLSVDPAGVMRLRMTCTNLDVMQDSPGTGISYSSARPSMEPDPMAPALDVVLHQVVELSVTPRGQILGIDGLDSLADRMSAALPAESRFLLALPALQQQFDEAALRANLRQVLQVFPSRAEPIGGSWTETYTAQAGIPLDVTVTRTLNTANHVSVVISSRAKMHTLRGGAIVEASSFSSRFNLAGSQSGSIRIDPATGWVREGSLVVKSRGSAEPVSPERGRLTSSVTISGTTRFSGE